MVRYTRLEHRAVAWMHAHGLRTLRYSIGVVFVWFGFLKIVGFSPATELVTSTVYWFDPSWFVPFLGWWEVAIGACFLVRPWLRLGLALLAPQMVGTFLPLLTLPSVTWQAVLMPTIEGQYIIKNLLIISGALVVGAHLYDRKERA
jgi:uncharacterized membrane protein YkgB